MTSPAPGWYPDPGGTATYRWWDGQTWTTATSDGTTTVTAQPQTPAQPQSPTQPTAPAYGGGAATPHPGYGAGEQPVAATPQFGAATEQVPTGVNTAYGTKSPFDSSGRSNYSHAKAAQDARADSFFHKNQYAMGTFIFVAINVLVALSTGLFFIGILPAYLAYVSFNRGEQLAPLAIGAAVIGLVVSIATFS